MKERADKRRTEASSGPVGDHSSPVITEIRDHSITDGDFSSKSDEDHGVAWFQKSWRSSRTEAIEPVLEVTEVKRRSTARSRKDYSR